MTATAAAQDRFLDEGLDRLFAYIPDLISAARRVWGVNDVCAFFHYEEGAGWRGVGRPRDLVLGTIEEMYPEFERCIRTLSADYSNPNIVPACFLRVDSLVVITYNVGTKAAALS